jgi:hypothetical protein
MSVDPSNSRRRQFFTVRHAVRNVHCLRNADVWCRRNVDFVARCMDTKVARSQTQKAGLSYSSKADSDSVNLGSNPGPPASQLNFQRGYPEHSRDELARGRRP